MQGGWGKNVVIVAALLGAGFFAAWLRFRPHLGHAATWTDGEVTYSTTASDDVRHAIWELPSALAGGVNTPAREGRPAVSPDGRWLVFCVGRPGLGADLWIAELAGDRARDPRPLTGLNGPGDECAPAFGHGALYFASNRAGGAGGLDLWRADFEDGRVGTPTSLGVEINGSSDDTDPAPRPGGGLAFSSNRADVEGFVASPSSTAGTTGGGYDLFLASPGELEPDDGGLLGETATWTVAAIDSLNGSGDEREPAFDAAGRTLVFARDEGDERGFELVRSMLDRGAWLPAEPISALNTAAHERGPMPSSDGFALYYARENRQGDSDLWTARSRELFRVPSRPVGWVDLLVLAALVLLALLAWLAKRWETIDVLYRCVLASLIVHLLMLWWFRDLYPEREEFALGSGTERTFRVELASLADARAAAERANSERSGSFELERTTESVTGPERAAAAPASAALDPSAADYALAPLDGQGPATPTPAATAAARPEAATEASVELNAAESFERLQGEGPAIELAEAATDHQRTGSASALERASTASAAHAVQPVQRTTAARAAPPRLERPEVAERSSQGAQPALSEAAVAAVELRSAESGFERLAAPAVAFEVDAELGEVGRSRVRAELAPARASGQGLEPVERAAAPQELAIAAANLPTPSRSVQPPSGPQRARADLDLADREEFQPASDGLAQATSAELSLAPTDFQRQRATERSSGPQRQAVQPPTRSSPATSRAALTGIAMAMPPAAERSALPAFSSSKPERRPDRARDLVELADNEAPAAATSVAETSAPVPETPLRPSVAARRGEREARSHFGPKRWAAEQDSSAPKPLARALATLEEPEQVAPLERSEFEHTPYRARFGEEKDIALEQFGGTVETERAVAAGLAYLADHQRGFGGWSDPNDRDAKYGQVAVGKTGLALLAFLGAGHTPVSETTYSGVAVEAVRWLLQQQDPETGHFGDTSSYSHGIATYALAECYALTKDAALAEPLRRAVEEILRNQYDRGERDPRTGGWGYFYPSSRRYDDWPRVSVTAWQVMALESARIGGLTVPDSVFEAAQRFLAGSFDRRRGWMRYSHDPNRLRSNVPTLPGSTPAALFALSLLGEDLNAPTWTPLRAFVSERAPRHYRMRSENGFLERAEGNLYFWYYGTLAQFRAGGDSWKRWNSAMKETLLEAQAPEGSWAVTSIYARDYARDTDRDRIYSTAMCVLTLEVYYRYFTPLLAIK